MIKDEEIQKTWEQSHEIGSPNYYLRKLLLEKLIPLNGQGRRALDGGCSTGGATRILLERGYEVHGIDLSPYAITRLEQTLPPDQRPRFHGRVGDLLEIRPSCRYDLIVLAEVLEHVEDDLDLLKRAREWLSAEGSLIITVPADPALWSSADVYSNHHRRYTPDQLTALVREAGLRAEVSWRYGFPALWIYTYLRNRWFSLDTIERLAHTPEESLMRKGLRIAASLMKVFANIDRLFIGYGKPVGLIVLAKP
jgi:SAM-dependent methyltransferase